MSTVSKKEEMDSEEGRLLSNTMYYQTTLSLGNAPQCSHLSNSKCKILRACTKSRCAQPSSYQVTRYEKLKLMDEIERLNNEYKLLLYKRTHQMMNNRWADVIKILKRQIAVAKNKRRDLYRVSQEFNILLKEAHKMLNRLAETSHSSYLMSTKITEAPISINNLDAESINWEQVRESMKNQLFYCQYLYEDDKSSINDMKPRHNISKDRDNLKVLVQRHQTLDYPFESADIANAAWHTVVNSLNIAGFINREVGDQLFLIQLSD